MAKNTNGRYCRNTSPGAAAKPSAYHGLGESSRALARAIRGTVMKKLRILKKPTRLSDITWSELYDEISDDWHGKADRLRLRRWRKLKQQMI
jgi:hypothetical protein